MIEPYEYLVLEGLYGSGWSHLSGITQVYGPSELQTAIERAAFERENRCRAVRVVHVVSYCDRSAP